MFRRGWGYAALACLALGSTTCDVTVIELCDPGNDSGRVGFYSAGDCVGLNQSVFRGHEWITFLGNRDPDAQSGQFFTDDQMDVIIDGNRHTDYPQELLVHLDNGLLDYLDALFAYHNDPDGQAEHFILRSDNTHEQARQESLDNLRTLTKQAVALWSDEQQAALTRLGRATHGLQDSYSPAHSVRVEDPAAGGQPGDQPWCFCKLKGFVVRDDGFDTDDIEFHDRLDDDRKPGHTSALDSIYRPDRLPNRPRRFCLDPQTPDDVTECMKPEALAAVDSTRDYLRLARELVTTSADEDTIDQRLDDYFAEHFSFCTLPIVLPDNAASLRAGLDCDRPPPAL